MSDWVIECHSSASKSPWHDYVFHELKRNKIFVLFMFSNLTAVWISRNFEDKIINQHLPCYSPPLTSLFVMSFLVCRGNYCAWSNRFYYTNIGFLYICPPTAFFVLFVINVMALVSGRERDTVVSWHSNFFRYMLDAIAFKSPCIDKFTSLV